MCARPNVARSRDSVAGTRAEFLRSVTQVVASLMPQGGYSITQMTGLSHDDLIDLGMAQAAAIAETWNPNGGMSLSNWVSRRLRNRLVDLLREANSISRGQYAVLQQFWAMQAKLGGPSVPLRQVREALLLEPETKLTPEKLDDAISAWTIAVARNISGLSAEAEDRGKKKESNDPGFVAPVVDEEEEMDRRVALVRQISQAVFSPTPYASRASFLYLFPGFRMKEVGRLLLVSESRISQVLSQVIPEVLIRVFKLELQGYDGSCYPPKVDREARKTLRRFRVETMSLWSHLPDEVREELDAEVTYLAEEEETEEEQVVLKDEVKDDAEGARQRGLIIVEPSFQ